MRVFSMTLVRISQLAMEDFQVQENTQENERSLFNII